MQEQGQGRRQGERPDADADAVPPDARRRRRTSTRGRRRTGTRHRRPTGRDTRRQHRPGRRAFRDRRRAHALCDADALEKLAAPLDPEAPPAGKDAEAWRDAVALLQEKIDPTAACTEDDRADVGKYAVAELRAALAAVQKLATP